MRLLGMLTIVAMTSGTVMAMPLAEDSQMTRVPYNNPGLTVDLGVGLWASPMPVDYDGDGDNDLLCATPDKPYNGLYFFENVSGKVDRPVFKAAVRLSSAGRNVMISYEGADWFITEPGKRYPNFSKTLFEEAVAIPYDPTFKATRAKQWKFCDYDGDGVRDLIVGASDWTDYGWDNAFNEKGEWTNDAIHGHIYVMRNTGTTEEPIYAEAMQLKAGGVPLNVYGCPSPNFVDMDKDGDLDIIAGEFLDRISYFENVGTRTAPEYAAGRFLQQDGDTLHLDLQMLQVVVYDWNNDGNPDIFVGKEDGRVVLMLGTGKLNDGVPEFTPPRYLQQEADNLKVGALTTPYSIDWDADGDEDIIAGDTAGYISFVENLGGGASPVWAKPVYLQAEGKDIRILAGPNGSIQGPAEAKWGYTVLNVADWDNDGLPDVVINSIWGKVEWYKNIGEVGMPKLAPARAIEVDWEGATPKPAWFWWNPKGKELVTQWRTSPVVRDLNGDGLNDLIMLDQEGYLSFFERRKEGDALVLSPPKRIFKDEKGGDLQLNERIGGGSGRRKFVLYDWDQDGKLDLLINSKNIDFMRNIAEKDGEYQFKNEGLVDPHILAGHTTCPAIVDWDGNGIGDLLIGAEDGFFYHLPNPKS